MGAEQSSIQEETEDEVTSFTAEASEDKTAPGGAAPAPTATAPAPALHGAGALSLDQATPEVVVAQMDGVMDKVDTQLLLDGATLEKLMQQRGTEMVFTGRSTNSSASTVMSQLTTSFRGMLSSRGSRKGADVLYSSKRGKQHNDPKKVDEGLMGPALHAALNHPAQLQVMLQRSLNVNAKDADGDRTALHWAAARGNLHCIFLLIAAGADKTIKDANGKTPAELAEALSQPTAHGLIHYGPPKPDSKLVHDKMNTLCLHSALNQPGQLRKYLKLGEQFRLGVHAENPEDWKIHSRMYAINAKDIDGDRTALHWAASRGSLKCLKLLFDYGADAGITDKDGKTPAALAMEFNQRAAHALIMEHINNGGQIQAAKMEAKLNSNRPADVLPGKDHFLESEVGDKRREQTSVPLSKVTKAMLDETSTAPTAAEPTAPVEPDMVQVC